MLFWRPFHLTGVSLEQKPGDLQIPDLDLPPLDGLCLSGISPSPGRLPLFSALSAHPPVSSALLSPSSLASLLPPTPFAPRPSSSSPSSSCPCTTGMLILSPLLLSTLISVISSVGIHECNVLSSELKFLATILALSGAWIVVVVFSALFSLASQPQLRTRCSSATSSSVRRSTVYGAPSGTGGAMMFLSWNCRGSTGSLSSCKMTHFARLITLLNPRYALFLKPETPLFPIFSLLINSMLLMPS